MKCSLEELVDRVIAVPCEVIVRMNNTLFHQESFTVSTEIIIGTYIR